MTDSPRQFAEAQEEGKKLWSPRFGDVYFDQQEGFDESSYVFVQGNQVDLRWEAKCSFRVGELGFGTGLNLLTTWLSGLLRAN
jgi:tRNA U34 5-methylaminomethyl-2-thiouridine-forming methyltransferase MnmC